MERLPDWSQRLAHAIDERRQRKYAWSLHDCAVMAADLVAATTGEDLAADFRGTYASEEEAQALLAARGWGDLAGLASHFLPRRTTPRRGDVVLVRGGRGPTLTVRFSGGLVGPSAVGVELLPLRHVIACWGVG